MIELAVADLVVEWARERLARYCVRFEVAGSVRRRKATVHDIEIVCIPRPTKTGHRSVSWVLAVTNLGRVVKGDPMGGKYIQILCRPFLLDDLRKDIQVTLDVFTATAHNWGLIYAIRTGSAAFSHRLARGWVRSGYNSVDGVLRRHTDGASIEMPEERDVFALAGLPFVAPQDRDV